MQRTLGMICLLDKKNRGGILTEVSHLRDWRRSQPVR